MDKCSSIPLHSLVAFWVACLAPLLVTGCASHPPADKNTAASVSSTLPNIAGQSKAAEPKALALATNTHVPGAKPQKRPSTPIPSNLERVAWCAIGQHGKLYCWGGNTPATGFDCSGLTQYSFRQGAGVNLPRTAAAQYAAATKIPYNQARKGDLVFFRTRGDRISHVGIYLGDNRFVHAPRTGKSITTSTLEGYWQRKLAGFGRIPGACRPRYS